MDDKEHYDRGMAMRRRTLGAAHVDRAIANTTPFQQAIYCGVPAGNRAFKEAGEVLAQVQRK